jgi:dihydrofolate reductase
MMLSISAAMGTNRVIGSNGQMPWNLPADLRYFKAITLNKTIVMGRKTWESIPGILMKRRHIILTRDTNYNADGAEIANSIDDMITMLPKDKESFIIGGAELYRQTLYLVNRIYLTEIDMEFNGDAYFPEFDLSEWNEVKRERHSADDLNNYDYSFVVYEIKEEYKV